VVRYRATGDLSVVASSNGFASAAFVAKNKRVTDDIANAESLLREIATELVSLPLDERARGLHLRVLGLKRVVSGWAQEPPQRAHLESTLGSLHALRTEVGEVRSTSEVRLRATARDSYRPTYRTTPPPSVREPVANIAKTAKAK
jgi:hypothetical protein